MWSVGFWSLAVGPRGFDCGKLMSCSCSTLLVFVSVFSATFEERLRVDSEVSSGSPCVQKLYRCNAQFRVTLAFRVKDLSGNFLSRPPTHPARKCALVAPRFGTLRRYHAVVHAGCLRSAGLGRFGDTMPWYTRGARGARGWDASAIPPRTVPGGARLGRRFWSVVGTCVPSGALVPKRHSCVNYVVSSNTGEGVGPDLAKDSETNKALF